MLRVATAFNVRLDMLTPSQEVRRQIPIWHHVGLKMTKQKRYGSQVCHCLMDVHQVEMAGDAEAMARRLGSQAHKTRKNCGCEECRNDRCNRGCENPHKCTQKAKYLLDCLVEKWDPCRLDQDDGLSLMDEMKHQNKMAKQENGLLHFNPDIDRENSLTEGIKIFTSGGERYTIAMGPEGGPVTISIAYTDGSAYDNSTANACAGAGIWFGDGDERNIHVRLPGPYQTNNVAEI
ncbi:hypothetical protein EDD18DRAFT_1074436 [Armillaria luteobubalina]|uniref:RNase H type-1 domain-containing protein n=1 Tax=Armillaria luteobubalina TaxID=153913 RepID=A0AA39UNF1_9AGAR|nr:hypothetical protein EDD18DRAFT_1074436 [Armillaria luteobubalina]